MNSKQSCTSISERHSECINILLERQDRIRKKGKADFHSTTAGGTKIHVKVCNTEFGIAGLIYDGKSLTTSPNLKFLKGRRVMSKIFRSRNHIT